MHTVVMILAVSALLGGYGGMHYYLYRKMRWVFPRHKKALAAIILLLAMSLFIVQVLMHTGVSRIAIPLAWLAYVWVGYAFLFLAIAGTADILIKAASLIRKDSTLSHIPQDMRSIVLGIITVLVCIVGIVSAQQINVRSYTLTTNKLQQPLTIVQITDLHLDRLSSLNRLQIMVSTINALHPDIVVSTGDLVDMQARHLDGISTTLAKLQARLGKFAVYGNHEAFGGIEAAREFTMRAGFKVLSNQGTTIDHTINIIGVDDPAVERKFKTNEAQEKRILQKFPGDLYTVLLKHQPIVAPGSSPLFDLQLSGHTHGGQIFPFGLLVKIFYRAPFGLTKAGPSSWLYVSKGSGTWGPPMRVLAEPEISVFHLQPAGKN
jgi:predicted MPP superfamily phosphohydrolase